MTGRRIAILLFAFVLAARAAGQGLLITEIKAVNAGTVLDEDGAWSDWIELYNGGPASVDLNGWFLTDDRSNLPKWSFPSTNLASGGFLVVFASAKDRRIPGRELHTSFSLKAGGEYLALVEPDGLTIAQEFAPAYPAQSSSFAYGFPMNGPTVLTEAPGFLAETPRRANPPAGASLPLALTELMYNPAPASTNEVGFPYAVPFSFIELKNTGTNTLDLAGVYFGSGIHFVFPTYLLAPGARVLVVYSVPAFESRYGTGLPVAGQFAGTLDTSGERLALYGPDSATIFNFTYDQAWRRITDGHGFSLVPVNEDAPPSTYGRSSTWRASGQRHGSPGRVDLPSPIPPILINEALTRTAPPYEDAIELYNPGTNDVDIGGWFLTDDFDKPHRFTMPFGAVVPAGGYLALDEHTFNSPNDDPLSTGFGLGDFGEEVYLFSAAANGDLTGFVHGFKFGTAEANVTFGRHVISTGEEHFVPQSAITFLAPNAGPKVGPVVISEIHYHPPDLGGSDNKRDEFIELHNVTDEPVPLHDVLNPSNTWRLVETRFDALAYGFPTGAVLRPNGYALVTRIATNDAAQLQAFRDSNHVSADTPIFGPWSGSLANSAGTLELVRPDPPEEFILPQIVVDRVSYTDTLPWPLGADGTGASIHRIDPRAYGNDPANWRAAAPSPGAASRVPPIVLTQPADQSVPAGATVLLSLVATGDAPLTYQWRFNGSDIPGATGDTLRLTNVLPAQSGGYACLVSNQAGALQSRIATLQAIDAAPPSLEVTSPGATLVRVATSSFTCTGLAADNVEVASVRFQNGSGPFIAVSGTTNWSVAVHLKPGLNTFRFVALDSSGNGSPTNTLLVVLQPDPARLSLLIHGAGAVSGAGDGRLLQIGRRYTLRAVPAAGHVFRNWLDVAGGVVSTNAALSFVMSPNLVLTANFQPGPFVELAGAYNGLFYDATNATHLNAGYFTLRVTPRGSYSGRLAARGSTHALHGVFDSDLVARQVIRRSGSNDLFVILRLASGSSFVEGTVSELRFTSAVAGHRTGFSAGSAATNFAGRYSAALTVAGSASNSTSTVAVSVGSAGKVVLHGRLPDRTPVAKEVPAGDDGLAPLYFSLYRNAGSAFGWVAFTNAAPDLLQGPLLWTRTGSRGFTNMIELRGRR